MVITTTENVRNNPRGIAGAVSVDAWRSPFDGKSGIADLFIDVIFGIALLGGGEAPVRFRLALRGATVHINVGSMGVLYVPPETVHRDFNSVPPRQVVDTIKTEAKRSDALNMSSSTSASSELPAPISASAQISLGAASGKSSATTREVKTSYEASSMSVAHRKTQVGYAFDVKSADGTPLHGMPWDPQKKRLSIGDNGMFRTVGDPPEPLIEVLVRREDLEIYDVQFTNKRNTFRNMHRNKQLIAIQLLKDILCKTGLYVDNLDEPFALIRIADVSPQEKRIV